MQRRWAAIYFAFFVVTAAGAYSVIALADQPEVQIQGPTYGNNTNFSTGGQQYQVTGLKAQESSGGGGHGGGGGGGTSFTGKLVWTNKSAQFTATLQNNSTVTYRNTQYRVVIPNRSNPNRFTLTETFNVSQLLKNDSAVYNKPVTINGTKHVVYRSNNSTVPVDQYLPAPRTRAFSEGDRMQFKGNRTTVKNVTTGSAVLAWTGTKKNTITLEEGKNITLADGNQYVVHFKSAKKVQISPNVAAYQNDLQRQHAFSERMNGFWMVLYFSILAAILIAALAYMPVRG